MALPVLVAVDEDAVVLAEVEAQLLQRYGRDYRVECLRNPGEALRRLTELRDAGADVALVLAGLSSSGTTGGELLEHMRQLHPHAKRALLVAANVWTDGPTAEAIRASMALGRIDYYVLRPAASPDEVFHEAVSDFLLEWAMERRLVPQTVHIVVSRGRAGRSS
jgi:thioredoxin reductase (NADPH)